MTSPQHRYQAIESAIVSSRLDGLEPTPFGAATFNLWIKGILSTEEAVKRIVDHYKRSEVADSDGLAQPNKLGITDSDQLRRFEADVTTLRMAELGLGQAGVTESSDGETSGGYDPKAIEILELKPDPRTIEQKELLRELRAMQGPQPSDPAVLDRFLADRQALFDELTISEFLHGQCATWVRGDGIAGEWNDIERIQLIVEIARHRIQARIPPSPIVLKPDRPPPPDGYATWLDYAVLTMDTRWPSLEHMFDDDYKVPDRQAMSQAVLAELRELRELAAQASSAKPPGQTSR